MAWQAEISSSHAMEIGSTVSDDSGHLKADCYGGLLSLKEIFSLCEPLL